MAYRGRCRLNLSHLLNGAVGMGEGLVTDTESLQSRRSVWGIGIGPTERTKRKYFDGLAR